jgi:hypothetical protein
MTTSVCCWALPQLHSSSWLHHFHWLQAQPDWHSPFPEETLEENTATCKSHDRLCDGHMHDLHMICMWCMYNMWWSCDIQMTHVTNMCDAYIRCVRYMWWACEVHVMGMWGACDGHVQRRIQQSDIGQCQDKCSLDWSCHVRMFCTNVQSKAAN